MTRRSKQGKPVLPAMIRKTPSKRGNTAVWKDIIESGLSVKPRSLNIEAGVKNPLFPSAKCKYAVMGNAPPYSADSH